METSFCYQIYFGTDDDVTSRAMEDEVDRVLLKSAILKLTDREKQINRNNCGYILLKTRRYRKPKKRWKEICKKLNRRNRTK